MTIKKKTNLFLFILFMTIITSILLLNILGKKLNPILIRYTNMEAKRFTSNIINSTINDIVEEELSEDLFILNKNSNEEVEILDYNTKNVNKLLSKINKEITKRLINLEDGNLNGLLISDNFKITKIDKHGVLCKLPIGILRNNPFFSNLGPTIPIKLVFLGQVQSNLNTKIKSYGINYLIVETYIHVIVEEQISMPVTSKKSKIIIDAPLTIKIINGKIPNYYLPPIEKDSSLIIENDKKCK